VTNQAREPELTEIAPSITVVDTKMAGIESFNAVYVVASRWPALIETGPGSDGATVMRALEMIGLGPADLAHLIVTHIHLDHAGGAGALLERFPNANVWVHERGAAHLAEPDRLIASTARTYGWDRMRALYGDTEPCAPDRVVAVADGDRIDLGDRSLDVIFTPGHASHHMALHDSASGAMFTGEAIGSHLPWADCYRPALPPPEVDVEQALASIERMRERGPTVLLTSHFGPIPEAEEGFDRAAERLRAWSETVRRSLDEQPGISIDDLEAALASQAAREYEADSGQPFDRARYDAIGSIRMNAEGLERYWRKRQEREEAQAQGSDPAPIS
jgi:glyoxylase-like metal-dependent hydrolase (beta-lactamase superfamily II)